MKKETSYWFTTKTYGWGWVPATWQGWVILLLFILIIIADFLKIDSESHSASDTLLQFIPNAVSMVVVLILICYKTGEKPRWRWGKDT